MNSLARDLRYGVRTLARTPGFSLIVILVMALGIGSTVALFAVVNSVLLRPLAFRDPGRIVRIYEADTLNRINGAHNPLADHISVSEADFLDWQKQAHSVNQMALFAWGTYGLSGSGQLPEQVLAQSSTPEAFALLGVQPALGRLYGDADDRPGAAATVVLSWGLWNRRYGGDPHLLGQTILLDAKPYTVIGVLPAWFNYPNPTVQLWTPVLHEEPPELVTEHGAHNFIVLARLRPGVSIAQAKAEMDTIQSGIRKRFPDSIVFNGTNLVPLLESRVGNIRPALYTLFGATGCLLLIACLNIANLLVARSASRRKESAIRTALGGSRARLVREQVVESVLLCFAGGVIGLLLASLAVRWLAAMRTDMPRVEEIHLDAHVILFSLGVMLLCGLVAGLIPALSVDEKRLLGSLQESTRSYSGGQDRARLRRTLLAVEIALTVVLLIAAGLLLKSYRHLHSTNIGALTENVLTMGFTLPDASYNTPAKVTAFYEQLLDRVGALPGVDGAALTTMLPGDGSGSDDGFTLVGMPPLPNNMVPDAAVRNVDPGYFSALKIPLLRGRVFTTGDRLDRGLVAIVSSQFVRQYLHGTDPIGKVIDDDNYPRPHLFQIVGVVAGTRQTVASDLYPIIYYPLYRGDRTSVSLAVHTRSNALNFALPVRKILSEMDPDLAVADILTMDQVIGNSTLNANFDATLLTVFAVLSLLLAAVGLFGVLSYIVAQRTGEIGVRIALGAERADVLRLVLIDGLRPAIIGLICGLAAAAAATRLISSLLYGTEPVDLVVFVVVAAVLLAVAALACLIPAWKASRLDPMQALRNE
jgi:predicted permease